MNALFGKIINNIYLSSVFKFVKKPIVLMKKWYIIGCQKSLAAFFIEFSIVHKIGYNNAI